MEQQKIVLITGASDGIGKQTALELARRGARVVVHGRDGQKCERVAEQARAAGGSAEVAVADLSSLEAVRALAGELRARLPRLDALVNNAGVYSDRRRLSADGIELTFAVNHLAHFLLTLSLLPLLRSSAPSRILNVSSGVHSGGRLPLDDLGAEKRYDGYAAYAGSKLANVLFTHELARRLDPHEVTANALHPGVIGTKLLRDFGMSSGGSLDEGAKTSVYLALSPEVAGVTGKYFVRCREATSASDPRAAERLWAESARLTGLPA